MERLTERVRGEAFPVRGITYMEIVEQLAKYEDREEGVEKQSNGRCKDCRYAFESENTNKLFCEYHEYGEINPNDYCSDWNGK